MRISGVNQTNQFCCAVNPVIGRELENKFDTAPVKPRKVLVAGGGIAGMKAALTAADRGHQVILCEKTAVLGGALRCEKDVSFKKKLDLYLNNQARRVMEHPNIEVRLDTPIDRDLAMNIAPDAIISALGARPVVPTFIKGYDLPHVFGAEEIYYNPAKAGKNIVILGGGLVGCELAIHMNILGHNVTIVEMASAPNFAGNKLHGQAVTAKLKELEIPLYTNTKAMEITENGVKTSAGEFSADTVIYAVGQRALYEEVDALRFCAPEFYSVGDCNFPANITKATKEAFYAARNIGRL